MKRFVVCVLALAIVLTAVRLTGAARVLPARVQPSAIPAQLPSSGNADAEPLCFASDVKALCCPSACTTKNSPKWERANDILRACMRGLGCSDAESRGATVFMRCECGRGKQ